MVYALRKKECEICKKEFLAKRPFYKTCSLQCKRKKMSKTHIKIGISKEQIDILLKNGINTRFKKGHIGYKGMLGKKLSKETRLSISKAQTGRVGYWKGKKRPELGKILSIKYKGRKLSIKTRVKIGFANKGKKCHFWKGGLTKKNYKIRHSIKSKIWRESVFKRDNYTCIWCGDNKGGNLEAHHIKSFSKYIELRFDVNNGITLCKHCHKKTDNYGKKVFLIDNWKKSKKINGTK